MGWRMENSLGIFVRLIISLSHYVVVHEKKLPTSFEDLKPHFFFEEIEIFIRTHEHESSIYSFFF